jgi:hypothetical protein
MYSTRFGAHCAILREHSYHFSKPSSFLEVAIMVEIHSIKTIYINGAWVGVVVKVLRY